MKSIDAIRIGSNQPLNKTLKQANADKVLEKRNFAAVFEKKVP
jgi:hypothetical protein